MLENTGMSMTIGKSTKKQAAYGRQNKINVSEHWSGNYNKTIQRNRQHRVHNTQDK